MFQRPLESGRALATRALRIRIVAELAAAVTRLDATGGSLLAAALAYQALFGLLAGITFAGGLVGWAFADPLRRDEAVAAIATAVPGLGSVARDGVVALASGGGLLSLIGLAGAAWAASNFYDVLDDAIGRVMPGARARGLLQRRRRGLLAIGLLAAAGLLALSVRLALPLAALSPGGAVPP